MRVGGVAGLRIAVVVAFVRADAVVVVVGVNHRVVVLGVDIFTDRRLIDVVGGVGLIVGVVVVVLVLVVAVVAISVAARRPVVAGVIRFQVVVETRMALRIEAVVVRWSDSCRGGSRWRRSRSGLGCFRH